MGREERERQEAIAHQRNQFAQAVARGQVGAKDRLGRDVKPGDRVLFRSVVDPIYTVVDVTPVLDPRMQPGLMRIQLQVTFPVDHPGNTPNPQMILLASPEPMSKVPDASDNGAGPESEREQVSKDAQTQDPPGPVTPPVDEPPT